MEGRDRPDPPRHPKRGRGGQITTHLLPKFQNMQSLGNVLAANLTTRGPQKEGGASLRQQQHAAEGGQGRVRGISVQPVFCRASPASFVKMTEMTEAHPATPTSPLPPHGLAERPSPRGSHGVQSRQAGTAQPHEEDSEANSLNLS